MDVSPGFMRSAPPHVPGAREIQFTAAFNANDLHARCRNICFAERDKAFSALFVLMRFFRELLLRSSMRITRAGLR
jgi:hypothetical protein